IKSYLILTLGLFFSVKVFATNYYLSNNGNDTNSGINPSNGWKTINRLNQVELKAGDSVFFHAGHTFTGQIKIKNSGSSEAPVVITSYGKGTKPVITGAINLSGFQGEKGNIYSVKTKFSVKQLYRDNDIMMLARHPNQGFESMEGGGRNFLIEKDMKFSPNTLTGANVRLHILNWIYETRKVEEVTGNKIIFDSTLIHAVSYKAEAKNGWGYYLDNKLDFLDAENEWFYDQADKKLYIFHGSALPENFMVHAATFDNGISIARGLSHFEIHNLHFDKYAKDGITCMGNNSHVTVSNCKFSHIYQIAINGNFNASHFLIKNNFIHDVLGRGVSFFEGNHCRISHNAIKRVGLYPGYGMDGLNGATAIMFTNRMFGERIIGHHNYVGYNDIDSTGYNGIRFDGSHGVCEYNTISYSLLTLNDGGAIYSWADKPSFTHHNIIRNNIINHVIGNTMGSPWDHKMNHGIYLDYQSNHLIVKDNAIRGAGPGIHVNDGGTNNLLQGNILYGNSRGISFAEYHKENNVICKDNICTNNVMFNTMNLHPTLFLQHGYQDTFNPAYIDSNIYASPYEKFHIVKETVVDGLKHTRAHTLNSWQRETIHDKNSKALDIDWKSKTFYLVNETPREKTFYLDDNLYYNTLDGDSVTGSIVLKAYSVQILWFKIE
ncbi:MAG: right-handed parallel beta-helix repeat-containing protein, partial [Bacteroidota bacterium]